MPTITCCVECCHIVVVLVLQCSACLQQCASAPLVAVLAREHERREALVLLGLKVGARLDKVENDLLKARRRLAREGTQIMILIK